MAGMETQPSSRVSCSIGYTKVRIRTEEGEKGKRESFLQCLTLCVVSVSAKRFLSMWSFCISPRFSNSEFRIPLVLLLLKEIPNENSW